jgi:predicted DNA-binding transcriptional regulator AlpA
METMEFLDYEDLAKATGVPASTIRVWFQRGKLPEPSIRVGQSPAWTPAVVADWIAENKRA